VNQKDGEAPLSWYVEACSLGRSVSVRYCFVKRLSPRWQVQLTLRFERCIFRFRGSGFKIPAWAVPRTERAFDRLCRRPRAEALCTAFGAPSWLTWSPSTNVACPASITIHSCSIHRSRILHCLSRRLADFNLSWQIFASRAARLKPATSAFSNFFRASFNFFSDHRCSSQFFHDAEDNNYEIQLQPTLLSWFRP